MELKLIDTQKPLALDEGVFAQKYREDLVHQVVNAYRAAGRSGTKAQKSRADVIGTTKKFKKQKGGGARHGDYRAPIFVGGGVTFAPTIAARGFPGTVAVELEPPLRRQVGWARRPGRHLGPIAFALLEAVEAEGRARSAGKD